jgi:tellurite methyltransferase
MSSSHSELLEDFLGHFVTAGATGPVLDLACGKGRNGIFLSQNGIPVIFADRDPGALEHVRNIREQQGPAGNMLANQYWQVDFETADNAVLPAQSFGGIMVFRYLHRPLMQSIKDAVLPGGIIAYETFTVDQAALGRPKNPDFLLQHKELADTFSDWDILHDFDGVVTTPSGTQRAIAQLVAIKPR